MQILSQVTNKDQQIKKLNNKITQLNEEIDRRKYAENTVQQFVKTLCNQNEKCKDFIRDQIDENKVEKFFKTLINET